MDARQHFRRLDMDSEGVKHAWEQYVLSEAPAITLSVMPRDCPSMRQFRSL